MTELLPHISGANELTPEGLVCVFNDIDVSGLICCLQGTDRYMLVLQLWDIV